VQASAEQEEDRQGKGHERNHVEDQRVLHERDVFFDFEQFHGLFP
jgi:hypothetical protein